MLLGSLGSTASRSLASLSRGTTAVLKGRRGPGRDAPAPCLGRWASRTWRPGAGGQCRTHPANGAFLPTQLTFLPPRACLSSPPAHPHPLSRAPDPIHQKPQALKTHLGQSELLPTLPRSPSQQRGRPSVCPGTQKDPRLTPTLRLALPHSPQLVFIQSCQFSPQISLHSPRAPSL